MTSPEQASEHISRRALVVAALVGAGAGGLVLRQCVGESEPDSPDEAPEPNVDTTLANAPFPRAFFFRTAEGLAERLPYEQWEAVFLPLGGVMGKVFGEELSNRSRVLEYFQRFKDRHPDKAVFVHFNGTGRIPTYDTSGFFAGHWLHRAGSRLTAPIDEAESVLPVADTRPFKLNVGRFRDRGDDVVITAVSASGDIDWTRAEQVQVTDVDPIQGTITVNRAAYETIALTWPEGSYLAPHVTSGPYGSERAGNPMLWAYNYSTHCPRDRSGRTCSDALIDDLAGKLGPGGVAAAFDGLQLDVFFSTFVSEGGDVDGDGRADAGLVDGVDTYAVGTTLFARELRKRLPGRFIMADGHITRKKVTDGVIRRHQRGFDYLSGIETEGFVGVDDLKVAGFSEGLNILDYWRRYGAEPKLSYINYKYQDETASTIDYARARLVFAAAVFADAAITYATPPPESDPQRHSIGVFDELWKGRAQEANWLGRPVGPARHLAALAPDLLHGGGTTWLAGFTDRLRGTNVGIERIGRRTGVRLTPATVGSGDELERRLLWELPGVQVDSTDLYVELDWHPEPHVSYPRTMARSIRVTAKVVGSSRSYPVWAAGGKVRCIFRSVGPGFVNLEFSVDGDQPVAISRLTVHAASDGIYREFTKGVVFANPSNRPYEFDLAKLLPGVSLRRLHGSTEQDPRTNNGKPLDGRLHLAARDGLFTVRM